MRVYIPLFLILITSGLTGQSINDVLRYSQLQYNSTARYAGVAGAFGALGADLSSASVNPAGIAEFRKSEFVIGLGAGLGSNTATLSGNSTDDSSTGFKLSHLGVVITSNPLNFDTKTFNIAIGINNLVSFNDQISYGAFNSGTRVERWLELANGSRIDELGAFEAGLAYDAEAILVNDDEITYRSDFDLDFNAEVDRSETIERKGGINEIYLAVASNKKNKFSWGLGLGIPIINFTETKIYREEDSANNVDFFNNLLWEESLSITGAGVNLKGGIIYKFTPQVRFGASIQSPTLYTIMDDYNTDVTYGFNFDNVDQSRTAGTNFTEPFEYQLSTPWRTSAGLSYIYKFGEVLGFISGDVEYVNYKSGSIDLAANSNNPEDQLNSDDINRQLDNETTSVLNYRVGAELAYKYIRLRGGAALTTGPWIDADRIDNGINFSGGIGYRGDKFYVDASYTIRPSTSRYEPYQLVADQFEQKVSIDSNSSFVNLTFGSKF